MNSNALGAIGLIIGLLGVLAGLVATIVGVAVAILVQWNETRRAHTAERWKQATAKRERLRAEFERVLTGAYTFESLTSIHVWVNPHTLPAGENKDRLVALVEKAADDLRLASVRLRLEADAIDVVAVMNDLALEFEQFQRGLARDENVWDSAQKIQVLVAPLDVTLRKQLDALTPPEPLPERSSFGQWATEVWNWFRR